MGELGISDFGVSGTAPPAEGLGGEDFGCSSSLAWGMSSGCIMSGDSQVAAGKNGVEVVEGVEMSLSFEEASVVQKSEQPLLEAALSMGERKVSGDDETFDFSDLSPLKTFGGDTCYAALCEDAILVPSRSTIGFPLLPEDGFYLPALTGSSLADSVGCGVQRSCQGTDNLLSLAPMGTQLSGLHACHGLPLVYMPTWEEHGEADHRVASDETGSSFQGAIKLGDFPSVVLDDGVSGSIEGLPSRLESLSTVEESASRQSCHLTMSMENCSSKPSSEADKEIPSRRKPSLKIVFRRSNPKRAASSRSSPTDKKPDQKKRNRSSGKKYLKEADVKISVLNRIRNVVTMKRSNSHRLRKAGHQSVWGTAEKLLRVFEQNDELGRSDYDASRTQNKRPKKGRNGLGEKKGRQTQRKGSSLVSENTSAALSNSLHLKDQTYHPFSHVSVKDSRIHLHLPKKNGDFKLAGEMRGAGVKSLELHGDKDQESTLTEDTAVENICGEIPGVSSRSGTGALIADDKSLLGPGTSPDSDVYHPVIDGGAIGSVCATPTDQDVQMDESAFIAEPVPQYALNDSYVSQVDRKRHSNHKEGHKGRKHDEFGGCLCSVPHDLSNIEKLSAPESMKKGVKPSKYNREEKIEQEDSNERSRLCLKPIGEAIRTDSNQNSFRVKSHLLEAASVEGSEDPMKWEHGLQNLSLSGQDVWNSQPENETMVGPLMTDKSGICKLPRRHQACLNEGGSIHPELAKHRRQIIHGKKKEHESKSHCKAKTKEITRMDEDSIDVSRGMSVPLGISCKPALIASTELSSKASDHNKVVSVDISSSVMGPLGNEKASAGSCHGLEGQPLQPRAAWALCDDCQKWRCIPAELADIIDETNCKWTCKDNTDKAFADCSIPQEKTNSEINAELGISDASGDEDCSHEQFNHKAIEPSKTTASQPASWTLIKSNLFLHRNRKTQAIDEIMVCHCKRPSNGGLGCGQNCLNRILNIECVRGTCPSGDRCSNQEFQKRKYAKLKCFRCGKKGSGLQLLEDASCGQFLIEYVGEVLDLAAYEARQRLYASRGQKHFYFMTLNGGEVIDACVKGNLGRFINHSCDPNCRTEKWMVNGEVCIGLFAIRDIKKGEEVTFDYNYVRVFGAAAKKCVCGSAECRGIIGSDPLNTGAIVQGDSDEEYLEPIMVHGNDERYLDVDGVISDATDCKTVRHEDGPKQENDLYNRHPHKSAEIGPPNKDNIFRPLFDDHPLDSSLQTTVPIQSEDTMGKPSTNTEVLDSTSNNSNILQTEEVLCKPVSDVQTLERSLDITVPVNKPASDSVHSNKRIILNSIEDKKNASRSCPLARSSRSNGTIKKARPSAKVMVPPKVKTSPIGHDSGHEGVEGKLNELLNEDGGITKRKDATKGYLKLLFVTAAEGDNFRGLASQSTRDLSLILDALLKTKSRMVLVDIINKNGLQMLHNIMKQNRSNFNRIPIIRKLLKVLEFLALKGILTLEHINQSPPCDGMESFKESMLHLTRHRDMQVHQIARNFRNTWMPRSAARVEPAGREEGLLDSQRVHCNWSQSSSFNCRHDPGMRDPAKPSCELDTHGDLPNHEQISTSLPSVDHMKTNGTRLRKHKSRWDQPSDAANQGPKRLCSVDDKTVEASSKFMKSSAQLEQTSQLEPTKVNFETHAVKTNYSDNITSAKDAVQQDTGDDDAPPGFGSQKNHPAVVVDMDMAHKPQKDVEVPPGFEFPYKNHYCQVPSKTLVVDGDVVMARPQERYNPRLTVSYGMPVALMQALGNLDSGGSQFQYWEVAPGMPFHPFPPLPRYPRGISSPTCLEPKSSCQSMMAYHTKEDAQVARQCHTAQHAVLGDQRPSGEKPAHVEPGARNSLATENMREFSHGSGRRFSRPYRWNNQRFQRSLPYPRERNDCRFRGTRRNGASSRFIGSSRRGDHGGACFHEGASNDDSNSNFHRQPHRN